MAYQAMKSEHPPSLELRPEIITPKGKLPPPFRHLRDRLWVSIQPCAHERIDPWTAIYLGGPRGVASTQIVFSTCTSGSSESTGVVLKQYTTRSIAWGSTIDEVSL